MELSFEQLWENLKEKDLNYKLDLNTADRIVSIINSIVDAREALGMTQKQLADMCGIKQSALARIETLKIVPKLSTIIKIAECVDVSIEAINKNKINKESNTITLNIIYDYANRENYEY